MDCEHCCLFYKQKTAYELRISDWSSDVCSSDLDMLLDYVDVAGTRARGGEPPCYCAIASRERMTRLRDAVLGAGLNLEAIDVADMALSHVLGRAAGAGEAVSALVLGNQGLRFVIVNDGKLSLFRRSEEHTSELQSLMRISYAVFCLKKKTKKKKSQAM